MQFRPMRGELYGTAGSTAALVSRSKSFEQSGCTTLVNCGQASKGYYALVDVKQDGAVACELRRA